MNNRLTAIYDDSILWQMSRAERACFLSLLASCSSPFQSAVEIGTYCGGSLRHIAGRFDVTYSLDLTHSHFPASLKDTLTSTVKYITGDTKKTLPTFLKNRDEHDEAISFFLIDGDHEYDTVVSDLTHVLSYKPRCEGIILLHDSWYMPTRRAIQDTLTNSDLTKYLTLVDYDFCQGTFIQSINQWMGGFCLMHYSSVLQRIPPTVHFDELSFRVATT